MFQWGIMKNKLITDYNEIIKIIGEDYKDLASIYSDKFGIVNAILERRELEQYDLKMFQCLSANAKDLFGLSREVSSGGLGVDSNDKSALIGCLAEALERYSMSFIPQDDLKFEYFNNLKEEHKISNFYTYSEKQYANSHFSNPKTEKIYWTKINSIDNLNYKYWPASLIYLPFDLKNPVAETTSTGMAAGVTIDDCIKSGLLELIERDALMINFLQRLNPPEIDSNSLIGEAKLLIDKIKHEYKIKIYKLYTDINVPVFLSYIYKEENGKVHYGIGASASFNSNYAIQKSIKECLFTYFYSKNLLPYRKSKPEEINTLYEHFLYYQGEKFKDLLFNGEVIKYNEEAVELEDVIQSLKENGIEVYYKELTTEDIVQTNIKVVKVIAPGLIDLNKSHNLPRMGATRFWEVPQKLKLEYNKELSKMPHPFP